MEQDIKEVVSDTSKKWYESRTIWLGAAAVLSAACSAIAGGADWKAILLAAVGALGIWLRTQTESGVKK